MRGTFGGSTPESLVWARSNIEHDIVSLLSELVIRPRNLRAARRFRVHAM